MTNHKTKGEFNPPFHKLRTALIFLVIITSLAACNLAPNNPTPTLPAPTSIPSPFPSSTATGTSTPSDTPYPTATPLTIDQPTVTPLPSDTPTDTPTPTATPTLPPPTATSIPPSATPVPLPPTATPIPPPPPRPRPTPTDEGGRHGNTSLATTPHPAPPTRTPESLPTATPAATLPPPTPTSPSAASAWLTTSTKHYTFHYLPNSPAQRDLSKLESWAEDGLSVVSAKTAITPNVQIQIYLVPRIFWQSGAAYGHELLISYADRNYTSVEMPLAFQHETTHALASLIVRDQNVGGLLGEGFAVWATGGHYHHEDLMALAATLTAENQNYYIPLTELRRDFYGAQHEIAYLEGGAYDTWLIDTYGLPKFKRYLDNPDNPQPIYGKTNAQLETAWQAALKATAHTVADVRYVQLQVRYYDVMREYETNKDPDARYLPSEQPSTWTVAILSHFLAPANAPANVELENKLIEAGNDIVARNMDEASSLLDQVATAAANLPPPVFAIANSACHKRIITKKPPAICAGGSS